MKHRWLFYTGIALFAGAVAPPWARYIGESFNIEFLEEYPDVTIDQLISDPDIYRGKKVEIRTILTGHNHNHLTIQGAGVFIDCTYEKAKDQDSLENDLKEFKGKEITVRGIYSDKQLKLEQVIISDKKKYAGFTHQD